MSLSRKNMCRKSGAILKRLTYLPWYIILLPLFYILNTNNKYFKLLETHLSAKFLLFFISASIILLFVINLFLKSLFKSGIFILTLQACYIFWGSMLDFLKTIGLPAFFTSYKFLLTLSALAASSFFIYLKKKMCGLSKPHLFFVLLTLILTGTELFISILYFTRHEERKYGQTYFTNPLSITFDSGAKRPDIFFFVFDEYTSSKALANFYHFDNSKLDSLLLKKDFYLAKNSKSNYNCTPLSISSFLNMEFNPQSLEGKPADAKILLEGVYLIKKSSVPHLLKKIGYEIFNFGVFDLDESPAITIPHFYEYNRKAILGQTLGERMKNEISWNFSKSIPGNDSIPVSQTTRQNEKNFSAFIKELKTISSTPRFVVGHLMLPHTPFEHDRFGRRRVFTNADQKYPVYDSLYTDQVIFANTMIDSIVHSINDKPNRPLILMIMGDHGDRHYGNNHPIIRDKQFMNLSAFYFSDHNYSLLYDSISPVNTFRTIFNKYFQSNLPILKDSTIMLSN